MQDARDAEAEFEGAHHAVAERGGLNWHSFEEWYTMYYDNKKKRDTPENKTQ